MRLRRIVNSWLHQMTDKEVDSYLDAYVKKELNIFTDGKAIEGFEMQKEKFLK